MKRKIAMLLSAAMVAGAMPMSAMAATTNSVSNTINVVSGQTVQNDVNLQIRPTSGNFTGSDATFTIELENATFGEATNHQFNAPTGVTLPTEASEKTLAKYIELLASASSKPAYIPYDITISEDKTSAEVTVYSFDAETLSSNTIKNAFDGITPYINIPLKGITAENDGDVKVTVTGSSLVTEGTYTVGTSYSSGSTKTTIDKVNTFDGSVTLGKITIKENVAGSLKNTEAERTITLKLNSGFKYVTSELTVETRSLASNSTGAITATKTSDDTITVTIPAGVKFDNTSLSSIIVSGIKVEPKDEEKNYGSVKVTVAGTSAGVTQETIEVAKRETAGFTMELVNEATTIVAGRTDVANSNLDEEKFKTAKIRFSENVAEAWGSSRLDFNVPTGVQIVGVDFTKVTDGGSNFSSSSDITSRDGRSIAVGNSTISIINEGRTLRFAKNFNNEINKTKATSFEMVLKLSVEAGYEGDIALSAVGAGASEGDIAPVVIAKAVQPIKLETSTTKVNIGYQDYSTADIVITETAPGMLLAGKEVIVSLDSVFSTNDIAITSAEVEVSGNELTVKDFSRNSGKYISFKIDNASSENAATVKIKNVKVGTSRSIPYGSYSVYVAGDAVINNYNETKNSEATTTANVDFAYNDNISKYEFADYINIVTSTGTLDNSVKVTIGEKTILINDKAVDMDVAPYIQASSNSTLVPLRFVTVALGVDESSVENPDQSSRISFDNNTKTATIYYGSGTSQKIIQFQAGNNKMIIDGTSINMENGVVAEIKDGRMFVPFRALGQALGVNVTWDAETRTAIYNA